VLPTSSTCKSWPGSWSCDPHRPRRVGAASWPDRATEEQAKRVAILTDPGGSVLPALTDAWRRALAQVAILTDPGGSVLLGSRSGAGSGQSTLLRSSPTPEGRCCASRRRA